MTESALPTLAQEAASPLPTPARRRRLVRLRVGAAHVGVDHQTLRRRINDGSISGYKAPGGYVYVDMDELDAVYFQPIPVVPASAS